LLLAQALLCVAHRLNLQPLFDELLAAAKGRAIALAQQGSMGARPATSRAPREVDAEGGLAGVAAVLEAAAALQAAASGPGALFG
jgi:hypothetical protein